MEEPPLLSFDTLAHPDDSGISLEKSMDNPAAEELLMRLQDIARISDRRHKKLALDKLVPQPDLLQTSCKRTHGVHQEQERCRKEMDRLMMSLALVEDRLVLMNGSVPPALHKIVKGTKARLMRFTA